MEKIQNYHWTKEIVLLGLNDIIEFGKYNGATVIGVMDNASKEYIRWLNDNTQVKFKPEVWQYYYSKSPTWKRHKEKDLVKKTTVYIDIAIGQWYEHSYDKWSSHFAISDKKKSEKQIHQDVRTKMVEDWKLS